MLRIQLKTKQELLQMGYINNNDPKDFLNLLSGQIVTINRIATTKNGMILTSREYPKYAIYDYLIKRVNVSSKLSSNTKIRKKDSFEYSLVELANHFNVSSQRIDQILTSILGNIPKGIPGKLRRIISTRFNTNMIDLEDSSLTTGYNNGI